MTHLAVAVDGSFATITERLKNAQYIPPNQLVGPLRMRHVKHFHKLPTSEHTASTIAEHCKSTTSHHIEQVISDLTEQHSFVERCAMTPNGGSDQAHQGGTLTTVLC